MSTQQTQPAPESLEAQAEEVARAIPVMLRPQLAPVAALLVRMARDLDTLKGLHHGTETDIRG